MHTHTHPHTHTQTHTHEQWENDFNWMGTCKQTDKLWSKLDSEHEDENCWLEKIFSILELKIVPFYCNLQ